MPSLGDRFRTRIDHVLRSLDTDVRRSMALIGVSSIQELNREPAVTEDQPFEHQP